MCPSISPRQPAVVLAETRLPVTMPLEWTPVATPPVRVAWRADRFTRRDLFMLKQGDRIPDVTVRQMTADGPTEVPMKDYCAGRKVVIFALPGAFTPTCSEQHLPGYVQHADAIRAKGVAAIACLSTADFFVMDAWGKSQDVGSDIDMLSDGNHEFTGAADMAIDLSSHGLGERSKRYAMLIDDGVVSHVAVDENPSEASASGAEAMLAAL